MEECGSLEFVFIWRMLKAEEGGVGAREEWGGR